MSKVKREVIRLGMQAVIKYPRLFPAAFSKHLKILWNDNQRRCAVQEYTVGDFVVMSGDLDDGVRILDLSCTSGFGETVHPDVLYIPEGFGKERWKYVMTLTPLPRGIEYFENPEFLVSHNGIDWRVPEGGSSPVVGAPYDWVGYNSDPSLYYENGIVRMIYRRTEYQKNGAIVRLLVMYTQDGVGWSAPSVIMEEYHHRKDLAVLMSPTVVKKDGEYLMWYVQGSGGTFYVIRAQSEDLYRWHDFVRIKIDGLPEGTEPWHVDVIKKGEAELLMTLCYQHTGNYKSDRGIAFASSADGGYLWNFSGELMLPGAAAFCEKSLYRGSAVFSENGRLLLYYSGQDNCDHWFTAIRRMTI
ncbi:MAG: hypothetical protein Q4C86_03350 [bacterium]|nr:hypothetical protein [bacterium]